MLIGRCDDGMLTVVVFGPRQVALDQIYRTYHDRDR